MALRYYCDIPGLEDNWVEVSEVWTLREVRAMLAATGDEYYDLLHGKIEACHIERLGGEAITDPADITDEALEDVDLRLVDFLGGALPRAVEHLRSLGPTSGRLQSNGAGKAAARKKRKKKRG